LLHQRVDTFIAQRHRWRNQGDTAECPRPSEKIKYARHGIRLLYMIKLKTAYLLTTTAYERPACHNIRN